MSTPIPFHVPEIGAEERQAVAHALESGAWEGGGAAGDEAEAALRELTGSRHVVLTTSATHALELAVGLLDLGEGDELVCPSFGFPSIANVALARGARPVFVDVCEDTLMVDPDDLAQVVTSATRVVAPVDYGGVGCDLVALQAALPRPDIAILDDAAQAIDSWRNGRHVGVDATAAVLSFHETKNVTCGEGGALLVQDDALMRRAEVLRDKGTNRAAFLRGEVDRYEWVDVGSSYPLAGLLAAMLATQLGKVSAITAARRAICARYDEAFADLFESEALVPVRTPEGSTPNGHLYAVRTRDGPAATALRRHLSSRGIEAPFHYVPLHTSAYAREILGGQRRLPVTERIWSTLLRLPVYPSLADAHVERVIDAVRTGV